MRKLKEVITRSFAAVLAASMPMSSFAGIRLDGVTGEWKNNGTGWWWQNADASYPVNQWVWLDGNGDNIAECYYFDENGYMAFNRDVGGYWVNAEGQWVDANGIIQTKAVNGAFANASAAQGSTNTTSGDGYISHADLFDSNLSAHEFNILQEKYLRQTTDNWRDYICYSYFPEWMLEKYEEEGAHIYWNGEKKEMTVEWPNGRANDNKSGSGSTDESDGVSDEIMSVIEGFKDTYAIDGRPDIEKEILILMYIATNCSYNSKADRPHTAEGCLLDGEAVCDGYSKAFKIMAEECGLQAKFVHNNLHAWNLVKINGNWYHVDATFADPNGCHKYYWGDEELSIDDINLSDSASKKSSTYHKSWSDVGIEAPKSYNKKKLEDLVQKFHDEYYITQEELDVREKSAKEEEKKKERKELEKKNKKWKKQRDKVRKQIDAVIKEAEELRDKMIGVEGEERERMKQELEELVNKRSELSKKWCDIDKEGRENGYGWE